MSTQNKPQRSLFERLAVAVIVFGVLAFAFLIANFARAGEIYSWETADGGVAFSDDLKKVPARYRDQVKVRKSQRIEDYAQFTAEDSRATAPYSAQLAKRLEALRAMNSAPAAPPAYPDSIGVASVTVSGIDLRLPSADTSEPIIVEKLRVQSAGQIATRHDTLVSQGGTPLAIVRGDQSAETGASTNILDEDDLEYYR